MLLPILTYNSGVRQISKKQEKIAYQLWKQTSASELKLEHRRNIFQKSNNDHGDDM